MSTSWSLLTILPDLHNPTQLKTSQALLLLMAYIMTLFYDLVSLQKFSMIKVESLRKTVPEITSTNWSYSSSYYTIPSSRR